ncbi:hypothetical protein TSST111916_18900 [Tsukamurella strandjordii]|uniref:hypothetical protein n=1 Tax=Tsukamurella TaxID=2060 RepID=UPI001C7CEE04|nr:hypothetical protein [Tsukamurella sp. TY48]GIZ97549.1 hypothetical protein TTY48_21610 [Tsukamurella sp. TY48]
MSDDVNRVEANLLARPDILRQIEASRVAGPEKTGRPARRPHMDIARARYGVLD